jgi:hypothetical protein
MRIESSVTSLSWIPSEAVRGVPRVPFDLGAAHYDDPPPDRLEDLESMRTAGRFRFANSLRAWIEVEEGHIIEAGHQGGGYLSSTLVSIGSRAQVTFQPSAFPELRSEPELSSTSARFVQTNGGRTGLPAPRRVRRKPFLQWTAPTVWTTLTLTIHSDGASEYEVAGASTFPRHWIYDQSGQLVSKAGSADFNEWYRTAFGPHTPWGKRDSRPLITLAESALERQLSTTIMRGGAKPGIRRIGRGEALVEEGEPGRELFLLLDGVLSVTVNGQKLAEVGPGAILGERALLEGGRRTATLRAVTSCTLAVAQPEQVDQAALAQVSQSHRREGAR